MDGPLDPPARRGSRMSNRRLPGGLKTPWGRWFMAHGIQDWSAIVRSAHQRVGSGARMAMTATQPPRGPSHRDTSGASHVAETPTAEHAKPEGNVPSA
jgi:hypothetical protein